MVESTNDFYREHAQEYAELAHYYAKSGSESPYINPSHPKMTGDWSIIHRMRELVPHSSQGLDAGCGAGARDVFLYWSDGYDMVGVDAVEENINVARSLHPEIGERVSVADLRMPLPFGDSAFDFVMCNGVIQHIDPHLVQTVTLPELVRVLRAGGVLQLLFKVGTGVITVFDKAYGVDRTFQLYEADDIVSQLRDLGTALIPGDVDNLGGLMYFTDPKPVDHCLLFARRDDHGQRA